MPMPVWPHAPDVTTDPVPTWPGTLSGAGTGWGTPYASWALTQEWHVASTEMDLWLFAVQDDRGWLLSGSTSDGVLRVLRVTEPSESISWSDAVDLIDLAGLEAILGPDACVFMPPTGTTAKSFTKISDSWHIFAHWHHWISVALIGEYEVTTTSAGTAAPTTEIHTESLGLVLLELGPDDKVSHAVMVFTPASSDDYLLTGYPLRPTNDHFLGGLSYSASGHLTGLGSPFGFGRVEGVAAAVRHQPDAGRGTAGHTVFLRDTDLYFINEIAFYAGGYDHNNEASSTGIRHRVDLSDEESDSGPPVVLAPANDGLSVRLIEATEAWEIDMTVAATTVLPRVGDSTGDLYSMISSVRLRDDVLVVAYRKAVPHTVRPEDGEIHLEVWDDSYNLLAEAEPLPSYLGARPHVSPGEHGAIYLAWDESDGVHLAEYRFGPPRIGAPSIPWRRPTSATAPYPDGSVAAEPADRA